MTVILEAMSRFSTLPWNKMGEKRTLLSKLLSRSIFVACMSCLALQIGFSFDKYLQGATTLTVVVKPSWETRRHPEYTICPDVRSGYNMSGMNLTRANIVNGQLDNLTWEMFEKITMEPGDLIERISWTSYKDGQTRHMGKDSDMFKNSTRSTYLLRYGRCVTFTVPDNVVTSGMGSLIFASKNSINLFVHHERQFYAKAHPKVYAKVSKTQI